MTHRDVQNPGSSRSEKEAKPMYRLTSWRLPLAVLLMATVILLAGGLAVASNMGFKLNKPIAPGGTGQAFEWAWIRSAELYAKGYG